MTLETATLAGGCFWCTEAIFQQLRGVKMVMPGYTGGTTINPTSAEVYSGTTGHAEAIQIDFDPQVITFEDLLEIFWHLHDPTSLNQQGYDIGDEYRSAIFYHSEAQKQAALKSKQKLEESHYYPKPIVTEIVPFENFYPADEEHKDFYLKNPDVGYCRVIISPKLQKLREKYKDKLKH